MVQRQSIEHIGKDLSQRLCGPASCGGWSTQSSRGPKDIVEIQSLIIDYSLHESADIGVRVQLGSGLVILMRRLLSR